MNDLVTREDADGLAVLTLSRPDKLNALNLAVLDELAAHCGEIAAATERIGAVVLRGAGKCFSAGHDLGDIGAGETVDDLSRQGRAIEAFANLPQPVIAAVHGHCYTGALELALAADLIVASESAKFADTHAKWGLVPFWGMSQRLPRRVGGARALELMLSCRTVDGREALQIGLADACYAAETFESGWRDFAARILTNSWHSHRANKALLRETDGLPLGAALAHEVYRTRGHGSDMAARIAAFSSRKR